MNVSTIIEGNTLPDLPTTAGLPSPADCSPTPEHADARVILTNDNREIIAHAALWWNHTPVLDGRPVGAIGGFAATDAATTRELLDHACETLRVLGCHTAIGPMHGNTWRRYRFVTDSDGSPPFLLEPMNPSTYPLWWQAAGFTDLAHYSSSRLPLPSPAAASPAIRQRLADSGITTRPLDPARFEHDLRTIHAISLKSFPANFLYTPLPEQAFIQSYLKVRDAVDPRFVRIAERDGCPSAFVFAIPDRNAAARGEPPAIIVKTLAVDPGSRCAGLGSLLVDEVHEAATSAGFTTAIHALQHETNTSLKITKRHAGTPFRRYTLFHRTL